MDKKKKGIILSILGILGLVVITAGVTYAFFNYAKEGTTDNVITTGSITFLYTEVSGVGNGISIENAYPISDEVGKVKTGEGEYFDFKITSDTFDEASIPYEVTLRKKADSTLDEEAVRIYLTDQDTGDELLLDNYNNLTQTSKVESTKHIEKTIYTDKVPANTEDYEKNFRLRMWIDENINFSQNEDGTYPYNGKTFTITVNVYANAKVITADEEELLQNANLSSISVDGTELTEVQNQDYNYEITLPAGTTETELDIVTENEYATVSVEKIDSLAYSNNIKRLSVTKKLDLTEGDNYFKITITSENKEVSKEYILKIVVQGTLLSDAIFSKYTTIYIDPTLTTSSNNTDDADGLYKWTDPDDESIETYYFRGNVTNNYVDFAEQTWRIIRINEDGTIRMIMTTGINNNANYKYHTNRNNAYYGSSYAKTLIDSWYSVNLQEVDSKIATGNFCGAFQVKHLSSISGGTLYSQYTPTFKCSDSTYNYSLKVGLITYDEAAYAGSYYGGANTEYYLYDSVNSNANYWTMSPDIIGSNTAVWSVYKSTGLEPDSTDSVASTLRPVINLKADTIVTGSGSSGDHWIVQ